MQPSTASFAADRQVSSPLWHRTRPFSKIYYLELATLPHSSSVFTVFYFIWTFFWQLSLFQGHYSTTLHHGHTHSALHRSLHSLFQQTVRLSLQPELVHLTASVLLAVLACLEGGLLWRLLRNNMKEGTPSTESKKTLHALALLLLLDVLIIVPAVELSIHVIIEDEWYWKILGVVGALLIPAKLCLHCTLTQDFRFTAINKLQGRFYTVFLANNLLLWLCAVLVFTFGRLDSQASRISLNTILTLYSLISLFITFKTKAYYRLPRMGWVIRVCVVFFCVEGILQVINSCTDGAFSATVDLDTTWILASPVFLILIYFQIGRMYERALLFDSTTGKGVVRSPGRLQLPDDPTFEVELLHLMFSSQTESMRMRLYSLAWITTHTQKCRSPYCYCFCLKDNYNLHLGMETTAGAKTVLVNLTSNHTDVARLRIANFRDRETVDLIKARQNRRIVAREIGNSGEVRISISEDQREDEEKQGFVVVVGIETRNNLVVISQMMELFMERMSVGGPVLEIALTIVKFMLFEYNNPIAALTFLYDYIYSKYYRREETLASAVKFQNLIHLCRSLLHDEPVNPSLSPVDRLDFSEILLFRERVYRLKSTITELIQKKIDVYTLLVQYKIDYRLLMANTPSLKRNIEQTQAEINDLLSFQGSIPSLLREASAFELCILERPVLSSRLRKRLQTAREISSYRLESVQLGLVNKGDYPLMNPANVVVFTRMYEGDYRVCRFTHNATQLLDVGKRELVNTPLREFMPLEIGEVHNQMMTSYLNGESRNKTRGVINTVVVNKAKTGRSVTILVKIEFSLLDEVYVAGLMFVRSKNSHPLIYTDLNGSIIASNKRAQEKLGLKPGVHDTVFPMFPNLFYAYFPLTMRQQNNRKYLDKSCRSLHRDRDTEEGDDNGHINPEAIADPYSYPEQQQTSHQTTESIEVLYLKMLTSLTREKESPDRFGRSESTLKHSDLAYQRLVDMMRTLEIQKKNILGHLSQVYTSSISIETNRYQRDLTVKEVGISCLNRLPLKIRRFVHAYGKAPNSNLADILFFCQDTLTMLAKLWECEKSMRSGKNAVVSSQPLLDRLIVRVAPVGVKLPERGFTDETTEIERKKNSLPFTQSLRDMNMREAVEHNSSQLGIPGPTKGLIEPKHFEKSQEKGQASPSVMIIHMKQSDIDEQTGECSPTRKKLVKGDLRSASHMNTGRGISPANKKNRGTHVYPEEDELDWLDSIKMQEAENIREVSIEREKKRWLHNLTDGLDIELSSVSNGGRDPERLDEIKKRRHIMEQQSKELRSELEKRISSERVDRILDVLMSRANNKPSSTFISDKLRVSRGSRIQEDEVGAKDSVLLGSSSHSSFMREYISIGSSKERDLEDLKTQTPSDGKMKRSDIPSSMLYSGSRKSDNSAKLAHMVRFNIQKSDKWFTFRRIELMMYFSLASVILVGIGSMIYRNQKTDELYTNEQFINQYSNIMRPAAYSFKESLKGWTQQVLATQGINVSVDSYYNLGDLEWYMNKLYHELSQVQYFYRPGMSSFDTVETYAPNTTISIFTYAHNNYYYFTKMKRYYKGDLKLTPSQKIPFWNNVRKFSRYTYRLMFERFQSVENQSTDKINACKATVTLSMGLVISMVFIILVSGLLIKIKFYSQLKMASSLLLRIEKSTFLNAISFLSHNVRMRENKAKKQEKTAPSKIFIEPKGINVAPSSQPQPELDVDHINGFPVFSKAKRSHIRAKKKKDSDKTFLSTYSTFIHFPKREFKKTSVVLFLSATVLQILSFAETLRHNSFYSTLSSALESSTHINMASSALQFLPGFYIRKYIEVVVPGYVLGDLGVIRMAGILPDYIYKAKAIREERIRNIFSHQKVCSIAAEILGEASKPRCLKIHPSGEDFTVFEGLEMSITHLKATERAFVDPRTNITTFLTYFTGGEYMTSDILVFYLTVALQVKAFDYMELILEDIHTFVSQNANVRLIYFLCFIVYMLVLRLVWVRSLTKEWTKLQDVLLVLNDNAMNNMYIKSYFEKLAKRRSSE